MSHIVGVPTTRVSSLFVSQQLLSQTQNDQLSLLQLQTQLSSGYRLSLPSDDAVSAMRIISLQGLIERQTQIQTNIRTNQSFLMATDSALGTVSSLLTEVRATAISAVGTTATNAERQAAAAEVYDAIQQLVETANTNFRGRYLFSGSTTGVRPFDLADGSYVRYLGNDTTLSSYSGLDSLFATNLTGSEVFGALSTSVSGTTDLNPVLTTSTRLTDLRGGDGINLGSIQISNGTANSVIDLSSAKTIGDVANLIRNNPPEGSTIDVEVTATGLEITLDSGNLSITDVGGGTTAKDLGIRDSIAGPGPLVSYDLDPILRRTTSLGDICGVRPSAKLGSPGTDNDLVIEADTAGTDLNGVTISFIDDGSVSDAGEEIVTYDSGTNTLTVNIKSGETRACDVVAAVNAAYDETTSPFTASLDANDDTDGGEGLVDVTATAVTAGGSGVAFDQESGIQLVNGGETYTLTFSKDDGVETIEDLLNVINGCGADVVASINDDKTGINVQSRLSGAELTIGENGGTTASQLGIRTFAEDTRLEDLNLGRGVDDADGNAVAATATTESDGSDNNLLFTATNTGPEWNDFSIELVEKVPAGAETLTYDPVAKTMVFAVNPGVTTAADLIDLFNATPGASDDFEISLAAEDGGSNDGSGFVLSSSTPLETETSGGVSAGADFTITRSDGVTLEIDLTGAKTIGDVLDLINNDAENLSGGTPVEARLATYGNGIELVDQSGGTGTLTVRVAELSTAAIDLGLIPEGQKSATGTTVGTEQVLTGADTNPLEGVGIFTALSALYKGLLANDNTQIEYAIDMLDESVLQLDLERSELGVQQQGLDALLERMSSEEIELRATLSEEYEVDYVEAVSQLAARQTAYEAALTVTAQTLQTSLLNYL